jgi:hypothetical protein
MITKIISTAIIIVEEGLPNNKAWNKTIIGRNESDYFVKTPDGIFVYNEDEMIELFNYTEKEINKINTII